MVKIYINRGTGERITLTEKLKYDRCVGVRFQENAWCYEPRMVNQACNYQKPCVEGNIVLMLDEPSRHRLYLQC